MISKLSPPKLDRRPIWAFPGNFHPASPAPPSEPFATRDAADEESCIVGAALVITGKGRVDAQTLRCKTISGVLEVARLRWVPVIVLAGGTEAEGYELLNRGAVVLLSIVNKPVNLLEAQSQAGKLLAVATRAGNEVVLSELLAFLFQIFFLIFLHLKVV
ncbi:MAG: glycerate kinase [Armatimonadetes bacterium]|nr:glycerate kinase [Armatimonadota bacterium]